MPSILFDTDINFPKFHDEDSTELKVKKILNYLYMLQENLRYTMGHLDLGNFSDGGMEEIGTVINRPMQIQLEAANGQILDLSAQGDALASRLEDAEGDISTLQQTATGLETRVTDAEGDISTLQQTAAGLVTRVTDAEGDISTLEQTATGLVTRVTDAEGNISTLEQTATGLATRVTDAEGNIATLTQTTDGLESWVQGANGQFTSLQQSINSISLTVSTENGVSYVGLTRGDVTVWASNGIDLTGLVTFSALSGSGTTTINGDNIRSGTITGTQLLSTEADGIPSWLGNDYKSVRVRQGHIEMGWNLGAASGGLIVGSIYLSGSGYNSYIGIDAPEIHLDGNIYMNGVLVSQA